MTSESAKVAVGGRRDEPQRQNISRHQGKWLMQLITWKISGTVVQFSSIRFVKTIGGSWISWDGGVGDGQVGRGTKQEFFMPAPGSAFNLIHWYFSSEFLMLSNTK
jgi:hypothetical protein